MRDRTTTSNDSDAPLASVPSWQVTFDRSTVQDPGAPPIATNSAAEPNAKLSCTPVAAFGPLLVTPIV